MVSLSLTSPFLKQTIPSIDTITLDIDGMKCGGCVKSVEKQISQHQGIICANVNLMTSVALVEYQVGVVELETIAQKLTNLGFPTQVRLKDETQENQKLIIHQKRLSAKKNQQYLLISAAFLLLFSTIGHLHHLGLHPWHWLTNIWFHWGLATASLLIPGREILLNGWQGLWQRKPNMNSLVGIGAICAYIASCIALIFPELGWECFFDEPVMLLGFIFLGKVLESTARNKAVDSLEALLSLRPQFARLVGKINSNQDQGLQIPALQVKPTEWVRVLSGEQFPVDGIIIEGETTVDESLLTGESLPTFKSVGEKVCAGTINHGNMVIVEAVTDGKNTLLSQIIATVEAAQTRKPPVQKFADTVSSYFTYFIIATAFFTFSFWYFWGTQIWSNIVIELDTTKIILSLKLAINVLVIACPCALGLATPTAILVGTTLGAENGLLIKGGDVLEQVKNLKTIVFDKTGTLTQGYLEITDIFSYYPDKFSEDKILQIAASLEIVANHPLAETILKKAQKLNLEILDNQKLENCHGKGVKGIITPFIDCFYLGNQSWLRENNIMVNDVTVNQVKSLQTQGKTVIYLAQNTTIIGFIALGDTLRQDAKQTIDTLEKMGLEVIMMSGDQPETATYIAQQLAIKTYYGGVTPQGKSALIKQIQQENPDKIVVMIGDGVNDAPAMTTAQFSIAMTNGAQVAIKTAEIILTRGKLSDVITAIHLSQITLTKIQQNLFWALSYNLIAIPLAGGFLLPSFHLLLNPAISGALMALSSIIVVTNSLLLKSQFRRFQKLLAG
ncbi:MAG: copper-translocating P-type ATPase [Cyanobacteria bacterium]|nr:copper-translocating P-type ATPase [Cyanobacteria bacterium CG_2015-16_32_12]NCO78871.1 copper-translocating P-type ATPase [Cyanobacteria bacterium CG_2015-22_32_23]NCQ05112.1 copper-translocating P-type ATPase [Cyanobacteria bacterium CG_2015-09_32_10]NCQ40917.1 copper-translocating P-type ATPase [Cyanobacteria bacterium CG_2015-04_32_10]NCS85793.1 copper-translocating P-type ATPase [Cyanobacteria bacterium CG_2015-02_32_10]